MGLSALLGLPRTAEPDSNPTVQRLLEESRAVHSQRLRGRERTVVVLAAAAFLAVAMPFAILVPGGREFDPAVAAALVALYVVAARIEFHTGFGWTVPTQLVFVPMLFLLPVSAVPLCVAVALVLFKLPEFASRKIPIDRSLGQLTTAWYSVGPAAVLAIAGPSSPTLSDWPVYAAALLAQFALDLGVSWARECFGQGLPTRDLVRELGGIYATDTMLSPVGLLAAVASISQPWAFLLLLPLLALFAIFSREREARIENALALSAAYRGTAHLLGEVLSDSDEYTGHHSRSVVVLAHQVGEELGLDETMMRDLEFGALLHDVGKMAVPNELINKPGALDSEEWALMQTHVTEGARMLEKIGGVLEDVGQVVRAHHERWDGTGYPDGLWGEEIPIAARVISCCDAFHAMTSSRSYREAMALEDAIAELRANSGTQFDPRVVDALISVVEKWDSRNPAAEALVPAALPTLS
jgi:putative nucleotidyltransferase with HDIG domain